jgi:dolichol-phosphate mannosyltransferase
MPLIESDQTLGRFSSITISVAAPAYNEASGIEDVVHDWLRFLRRAPGVADFEIVVCNDGSRDRTGEILDALARDNRELRVVHFVENQGAAAALAAAIAATKLDWVLLLDSDGQFPIENLDALRESLSESPARAAMGCREKKDSRFARFGTWASGLACNLLYGTRLKDFNSACKLVAGPLLRAIPLEAKGMNYSTEITAKLLERGEQIVEVDIDHRPRVTGVSNMRLVRGATHRLLFVGYLACRRALILSGTLKRPG